MNAAAPILWPPPEAWPANILRFHLAFPAPMDAWRAMEHVALEDAAGNPLDGALLDLPDGLWSADQTVLTVLLHPARLKTGVGVLGPVLEGGGVYRLRVGRGLARADGTQLAEDAVHPIRAVAAVTTPLRLPMTLSPGPGTSPVELDLARPLDFIGLRDGLALLDDADRAVAMRAAPTAAGARLTPAVAWPAGPLRLLASPLLEDACGNRPGAGFERAAEPVLLTPATGIA